MERKSLKEYSVVFLVEDEKFKLRYLPSRTSSLLCSAAKQKHFVNWQVVNHNCDKRKIETNQCEDLTASELRTGTKSWSHTANSVGTSLEFAAFDSGPDAKDSRASAFWFFLSTTVVFAAVQAHSVSRLPKKKTSLASCHVKISRRCIIAQWRIFAKRGGRGSGVRF